MVALRVRGVADRYWPTPNGSSNRVMSHVSLPTLRKSCPNMGNTGVKQIAKSACARTGNVPLA